MSGFHENNKKRKRINTFSSTYRELLILNQFLKRIQNLRQGKIRFSSASTMYNNAFEIFHKPNISNTPHTAQKLANQKKVLKR